MRTNCSVSSTAALGDQDVVERPPHVAQHPAALRRPRPLGLLDRLGGRVPAAPQLAGGHDLLAEECALLSRLLLVVDLAGQIADAGIRIQAGLQPFAAGGLDAGRGLGQRRIALLGHLLQLVQAHPLGLQLRRQSPCLAADGTSARIRPEPPCRRLLNVPRHPALGAAVAPGVGAAIALPPPAACHRR